MARNQIRGIEETFSTLKQIDKVLYNEAVKDIKKDVRPLVDTAKSMTPQQTPLSGWRQGKASGTERQGASRFPAWENNAKRRITTRFRRERIKGMGGRRITIRVVQGSASGAVFDMAGRKNTGNPIDRGLQSAGFGKASRAMWRAADKHLDDVQQSVQRSVFSMEDIINEALRDKGFSGSRLRAAQSRAFGR